MEPGRRAAAYLLTRDQARRLALNITMLQGPVYRGLSPSHPTQL
jgi:hypothetical protein